MAGTIVLPGGGTIEGTAFGATAGAAASVGIYDLASYYAAGYTDDDFYTAEDSYVSTLDSTTASLSSFAVFSCSDFSSWTYGSWKCLYMMPRNFSSNAMEIYEALGVMNRVCIWGCNESYFCGCYFDSSGRLTIAVFENPYLRSDPAYLGVYSLSSFNCLASYPTSYYFSTDYVSGLGDFYTNSYVCLDFSRTVTIGGGGYVFVPSLNSSNGNFSSSSFSYPFDVPSDYFEDNYGSFQFPNSISLGTDSLVAQPSGTDSTTRTASLMQTINNYNIDNSYTDNSTTVNYFIGSLADDGSVSDIYAPNFFDEDTMIFTEPETGTKYQAAGWLYNYETRTYGIAFDSGVLSVNGTGVDYVRLTYGDNAVSVEYFQGDAETLVSSSSYAYVMASQSACNINGHSYTYQTVKEPTCTAPGERKYTCSVCGDEYAEDIPTVGHSYEYSIYQAPTCTSAGIGLYTCSTCGDQYTEPIAATGHTDKLIEYVPTVYDDNGVVVTLGYSVYECSVCGTQYTVNDEVPVEEESWFSWLGGLFKKAISAIVNGFASGIEYLLEHVIGGVSDFIVRVTSWAFNLFDGSALVSWFDWFSEDNAVINNEFAGSGAVSEVDVWVYSFG